MLPVRPVRPVKQVQQVQTRIQAVAPATEVIQLRLPKVEIINEEREVIPLLPSYWT